MKNTLSPALRRSNYLHSETDAAYHELCLKLGISDSAMNLLYILCERGDPCPLQTVYRCAFSSKQTVHSALRKLETEDILFLKQHTGRAKKVCLTEKGREYTRQTAGRLFEAEGRAFDTWTTEEINTYLRLMEKYVACLRTQIERI